MEVHSKRKIQRTVTLRIDEDVFNKLYDEADIDSISLNSLVNSVLKRYVEWNKYEDRSAMIYVAASVLKDLFNSLSKDQVITLAKDKAKDAIYNIVIFMHGKIDLDVLISWYIQRMKYSSEISEKNNSNGIRKIIFKHDLGDNWSLYHKTIFESICTEILSVPIKVDITSSTIRLEFKN